MSTPTKKIKLIRISTVPHSLHLLLRGQMKFMGENGLKVTMMCSKGPEVSEMEAREQCDWIEVPLTRKFSVWQDLKTAFYLVRLFRKLKPDIVHSHSPKAGTVGQLAAWLCRVPLRMHTIAGLPLIEFTGPKRKLLDVVEKMTYACSHWILPNSKVQAEYIINNGYTSSRKIHVIGEGSSNGVNLDYFRRSEELDVLSSRVSEELKIKEGDFVLSFVGRLTNYKGVNELVKAYSVLKQQIGGLKLVLVGPFEELNPLEPEVLQTIQNDDGIHCTGHVEDIRPYLGISDLFVFPSYREGFPQSLMQASALGLACVASDINGCNEIIENGQTGLLIQPKSINAIVDAVLQLHSDDDGRRLMGQNGVERMRKGYDQQVIWNELLNFYKDHLK